MYSPIADSHGTRRLRTGLLLAVACAAVRIGHAQEAPAPAAAPEQAPAQAPVLDQNAAPPAVAPIVPGTQPPPAPEFAPVAPFVPRESYLDVYSGITYTDNVARTYGAGKSDEFAVVGTDLNIHRQTPKLQVDAIGDLDWVDFLGNTFPSRFFGNFDGTAQYGRATDWFNFSLRDTFGQLNTDPLAAANSADLENVNFLAAGPRFNIPLSYQMHLSLYGLYSKVSYQKTDQYDSNSYLGGAALTRQLSLASTAGLVAEYQTTDFSAAQYGTYNTRKIFVRYAVNGRRTTIKLDVGYEQIKDMGSGGRGLFLDADLARRITPSMSVFIRGRDAYSATGDLLQAEAGAALTPSLVGQAGNIASATPFHERTYTAGWRFARTRTSLSLEVSRIRDAYEQRADLDNNTTAVIGSFEHRLTPTVSFNMNAWWEAVTYLSLGRYNQRQASVALMKRFGHLAVSVEYENFDQTSAGAAARYRENRFGARVIYGVGSAALGTGGPGAGGGINRAAY
jgi:hypothetical protein